MNCCIKCFKDTEIRSIINSYNNIGNCDFCGSSSIPVYDVCHEPNPIADLFIELINIYNVSTSKNDKPLKDALRDDWDIFSVGSETLLLLIKKLCVSSYPEDSDIFLQSVTI